MSEKSFTPEEEALISKIDSSLEVKQRFGIATLLVYQVQQGNDFFTLKGVNVEYEEDYPALLDEIDLLSRAEEARVNGGIAHIVKDYGVQDGYHFMLKEFKPGDDAYSLKKSLGLKLDESEHRNKFYTKLNKTIDGLHYCDAAGFDINRKNIIVAPSLDDVCFIDPTGSKVFAFREQVSHEGFEELKTYDSIRIYNLFHKEKREMPQMNHIEKI